MEHFSCVNFSWDVCSSKSFKSPSSHFVPPNRRLRPRVRKSHTLSPGIATRPYECLMCNADDSVFGRLDSTHDRSASQIQQVSMKDCTVRARIQKRKPQLRDNGKTRSREEGKQLTATDQSSAIFFSKVMETNSTRKHTQLIQVSHNISRVYAGDSCFGCCGSPPVCVHSHGASFSVTN